MQQDNTSQEILTKEIPGDFLNAWSLCLEKLQKQLSSTSFNAYIKEIKVNDYNEALSTAIIYAPSKFLATHIEQNFKFLISSNLNDILGHEISLKIQVDPNAVKKETPIFSVKPQASNVQHLNPRNATSENQASFGASQNAFSNQSASFSNSSNIYPYNNTNQQNIAKSNLEVKQYASSLNPAYTFSRFVVGNNNQFCHAAAMQVAENPGSVYNPLFIYGGSGLGKTHLLHAIGNEILVHHPDFKVVYLSSQEFTNDVVNNIRTGKMAAFREQMRSIDVLLIDDIQFIANKNQTQEEFFHTFNTLHQHSPKRQIVITSDKMPQDIQGIEERLLTRFAWGLIADIQAPDFETRVAILKRKAENDGFFLDDNVAFWIAEHICSNVRELEGALTRLNAFSSLQKAPISIELAESVFQHLYKPNKTNLTVDDIKGAVANQFNLKVSDIISKRRTKNLSFPRHIAMYLCRKHTTCSYPEIGAKFGGRDHSSVIHATNVVSKKIEEDPEVKNIIKDIERSLLS